MQELQMQQQQQFQQQRQLQQQQLQARLSAGMMGHVGQQLSGGNDAMSPQKFGQQLGGAGDSMSPQKGAEGWSNDMGSFSGGASKGQHLQHMQQDSMQDSTSGAFTQSGGEQTGASGSGFFQGPQTIAPPSTRDASMGMNSLGQTAKSGSIAAPKVIPPMSKWGSKGGPGFAGQSMGMANGGLRFGMQIRGKGLPTPLQRMQMQQAQHEQRMLHQQQQGSSASGTWGTSPAMHCGGSMGKGGKFQQIRPKAPGMINAGGGAQRPPGGAQSFPPALQTWLQKLFSSQTQSGEGQELQKMTHIYLRHWVQQWVKTGELWQRNWADAPLPTTAEIKGNLPPGSLSGAGDVSGVPRPPGPRVISPPVRPGLQAQEMPGKGGFGGQMGFDNKPRQPGLVQRPQGFRERSRSRDRGRAKRHRSGTPKRRRQRSDSTSRSRSRKRSRSSSRSRGKGDGSSSGSKSDDASENDEKAKPKAVTGPAWAAKGKGKAFKGGKVPGVLPDGQMDHRGGKPAAEEQKKAVKTWLDERLQIEDFRGRHKELQKDIERLMAVNAKRFRQHFQQTVAQYVTAFYVSKDANAIEFGGAAGKVVTPGEQQMRAQRAARFQSHLHVEKTTVAMVSFNVSDGASLNGGPIVGSLNEMCSREEAREREMTRQLDKFEWKKGTSGSYAEVNLELATKKYQRSSADKAYRSQDVRTLDACWRTMEYLMLEVLDADIKQKPAFAVQSPPYIEVYSYLRDRTRSCRVDLHLQQPRSTTQRCFVETHECCLRFEMMSLFLLQGQGAEKDSSTEKYDEKLGLKAISQTIEPLLNAYQGVRDKQLAKSILAEAMGDLCLDDGDGDQEYGSPFEPAIHRYIILLLMAFSAEELLTHLAKLSRDTLSHPLINFATQAYAAFQADDYSRFLRLYREADFLTAVAMSGVADLARLRALWLLVRCTPPGVADKVKLSRIRTMLAFASDEHARSFLSFHGVKVVDDAGATNAYAAFPKRNSPEAANHPLLSGPARRPEKCEYPKGADSMLVSKFEALGLSRADIVFGSADPVIAEAMMDATEGERNVDEDK